MAVMSNQHLVIFAEHNGGYFNVLHNLQHATQLPCIQLHHVYAQSLANEWPACTPNLQEVEVEGIPEGLPKQFDGYPFLRYLNLSGCYSYCMSREPVALPTWFL